MVPHKNISQFCRLEDEKLNVWSALFNLENNFGTYDSLMSVCKEASNVNDNKAVFTRLATVFESSAKYSVRFVFFSFFGTLKYGKLLVGV